MGNHHKIQVPCHKEFFGANYAHVTFLPFDVPHHPVFCSFTDFLHKLVFCLRVVYNDFFHIVRL